MQQLWLSEIHYAAAQYVLTQSQQHSQHPTQQSH